MVKEIDRSELSKELDDFLNEQKEAERYLKRAQDELAGDMTLDQYKKRLFFYHVMKVKSLGKILQRKLDNIN